ncbi:hypothetical protein [Ilumatobacter nonamiensis]|uniref:hypothetical protein n=1 Tax=Ilumatobacter nonamiensis TaxID=467093 RepID=UPI00034C8B4C|nr:hypothetical protein [Ilumatobacter nonamiensis]
MTFAVRELSPARIGPRVRLFLARRPWVRWICIAAVAALAAALVHDRMQAIESARQEWAERVEVPVAIEPAAPGEAVAWQWREFPSIAVPVGVAADLPSGAAARRQIGRGEVIVAADLEAGPGPAAAAEPGEVVVPISDPLVAHPEIGVGVAVYSDGLVLAESGRIVHIEADVVFVAVAAAEAPIVAAAAQTRQASLGFLGPR